MRVLILGDLDIELRQNEEFSSQERQSWYHPGYSHGCITQPPVLVEDVPFCGSISKH